MSKPNRWMPLDWGDYWRDTNHLNAAEHGAYMNLLGNYWVTGKPLPDDDVRLARMAHTSKAEWRRVRDVVRAFFQIRDGLLHHKRVEREIARAAEVHARYAQGAMATNAKRRARRAPDDTPSDTPSVPPSDAPSVAPGDTQSPSPSHQDSVPIGTGADAPPWGGADSNLALKSRIFGPCLGWLAAQSKISEGHARTITARWCAKFGDGPVLEAFSAAARQAPLDPVPYMEKVLHNAATFASEKLNTTTGPAAAAYGHAPGQPRAVRAARASAIDHLAGLRDALGLGSVETVPQPAAPAQREQPQPHDRGI